jgi:hypothetical protein
MILRLVLSRHVVYSDDEDDDDDDEEDDEPVPGAFVSPQPTTSRVLRLLHLRLLTRMPVKLLRSTMILRLVLVRPFLSEARPLLEREREGLCRGMSSTPMTRMTMTTTRRTMNLSLPSASSASCTCDS